MHFWEEVVFDPPIAMLVFTSIEIDVTQRIDIVIH